HCAHTVSWGWINEIMVKRGIRKPDQLDRPFHAYSLGLEMLAKRREKPKPDFLVKYIKCGFFSAPDQHLGPGRDDFDHPLCSLTRADVSCLPIRIRRSRRIEVSIELFGRQNIVDLIHKHVDSF